MSKTDKIHVVLLMDLIHWRQKRAQGTPTLAQISLCQYSFFGKNWSNCGLAHPKGLVRLWKILNPPLSLLVKLSGFLSVTHQCNRVLISGNQTILLTTTIKDLSYFVISEVVNTIYTNPSPSNISLVL